VNALAAPGVEAIFGELIELAPEHRASRLSTLCDGNTTLHAEVIELLKFHDGAQGFLETRDWAPVENSNTSEDWRRLRIPGYALVGILGAGGMGIVYLAEQHRPRRRVALKVIRPGPGSHLLISRFMHEAEVLGRLHHPGIAQIFEAGVGEHVPEDRQRDTLPVPFIAMEFVEGAPLHEYARTGNLSPRDRVRLMAEVCDAVDHAHQRGVIHRDLKPANVLISSTGVAKVLDFGVARLLGAQSHATQSFGGEVIGTLAYMSPEQVSGDRDKVDTRTDVYALGVMLYELLVGKLPVDPTGLSLDRVSRAIREQEPALLGTIDRDYAGDLEAVLTRALAKDPARRYASVSALRADLLAYLDGRAVAARADSSLYIFRKSLEKNRYFVLGAAAAFTGLAGFAVYAQRQSVREEQAKLQALDGLTQATAARQLADAANARLSRSLYFSRIGYAQAAAAVGDARGARRALSECDPAFRSWEWNYLSGLIESHKWLARPIDPGRSYLSSDDPSKGLVGAGSTGGAFIVDPQTGEVTTKALTSQFLTEMNSWNGELAVINATSGVQLFRLPSFEPVRLFEVPNAMGRAHRFGPDGSRLYTVHQGNGVFVFDTATGAQLAHWDVPKSPDYSLAADLSADGTIFAAGGTYGVIVFNTSDGSVLARIPTTGLVMSISIKGDSPLIAYGCADRFARVYDLKLGREIFASQVHANKVTAIALSPNTKLLATGSTDSSVVTFDLPDGTEKSRFLGHESTITGVVFSSDSATLYSSARDGTLRAWDVLQSWDRGLLPLRYGMCGGVVYHNGRRVVATPGKLVYAEPGAPSPLDGFKGNVTAAVSSGGKLFAFDTAGSVAASDGSRRLWTTQLPHPATAICVRDQRLWATTFGGQIISIDAETGSILQTFSFNERILLSIAFLGDRLVAGTEKGEILLVRLDGTEERRFAAHDSNVWSLVASPDLSKFVSTGEDGRIRLWNSATCTLEHEYPRAQFAVYGTAFSPGGTRIACGGYDNSIRIFSTAEPIEIMRLVGHTSLVSYPAFSPDGSELLSASGDGTIRVWKAAADQELQPAPAPPESPANARGTRQ
jgi:eukaryotic-like serine/threonine-protein kinase